MPSNNYLISTIKIHFKHLTNMFNYFVDYAEELETKNQQLEMKNQQLEDHAEQLEMKNQQLVVYAEQLEEMNRKLMEEVKQLKGEEKGNSKVENVNVEKEDWNNVSKIKLYFNQFIFYFKQSVDNIFVLDSDDEKQSGEGDISVQVINGRPFSSSSDNDAEIQSLLKGYK